MMFALTNFCYYNGSHKVCTDAIVIREERIDTIIPQGQLDSDIPTVDLNGNYLAPGFIDLQVNGGVSSFFPLDLSAESLRQIYEDHLLFGTTHFLPTMITSSLQESLQAIEVVKAYMKAGGPGVLGLHLEGPFISTAKKGAHNKAFIRKPTFEELELILKAGEGVIRMMTVAPELFNPPMLEMIRSRGIVISAGHSEASVLQAKDSFKQGVSCVTHLYNAMSQFNSREPGLVGAALDSEVYCGIIADGLHCDYTAVRIAYKLKKKQLFLVSDATLIGNEDTVLNGRKYLYRNGKYLNEDGNLAGSNITMWHNVVNCIQQVGIPVSDAFDMATRIPAFALGLSSALGSITINQEANMVVLSKDLNVASVIIKGQYRKIKGNRKEPSNVTAL
jgi:N-acetylglucosamine-6-phosphate deacetylase